MNKKGISLLLLSVMLFSVSGCGNTAKRADNNQSSEKKEEKSGSKMTISDVDLNDPFRIQRGTLYFWFRNCSC